MCSWPRLAWDPLHEAIDTGWRVILTERDPAHCRTDGTKNCSTEVTVLDDGTLPERRGSINIDDEGTPSGKNTCRRGRSARLYAGSPECAIDGVKPTGNGRRQSFAHVPMPRMTNTHMLGGKSVPKIFWQI